LDVASGSGDLPIAWARRAKREGVRLEISTLDISEFAVEEQLRRAAEAGVRIAAIRKDCLSEPLPTGFDVVTNSLFMHHLEDDEVVALIRAMRQAARRRVVICDLERSRLNLGLVSIGSQLLSRSKVVHHDARLSVRGAYTTAELGNLAERATGECVRVERLFPCRMLVSLDRHQRVR
jgi:2-polyprenyl-3-methyl-5-hydroxy-6-metoxy-1,4-benzoquinol methylase